MDATVIYYGRLTSDPERLSSISWPVLGIFAGLDTGITAESVNEFEKTLNDLGIQNEIHIYPNVNHAFANPSGERYAPEETKDAWEKTLAFLEQTLKNTSD
jgi:carboxymethylenebutenolidase